MNAENKNALLFLKVAGWVLLAPFLGIMGIFILFTFYFTLLPVVSIIQLLRFFVDPGFRESLGQGSRVKEAVADRVYFHPGHTWARAEGGCVAIGPDEFASSLVGSAVKAIESTVVGTELKTGDKVWTLRLNGRRLEQVVPLGGTIIEVNTTILLDPSLLARLPVKDLWIVKMRPGKALAELRDRLTLTTFAKWNEKVRDRILARFSPKAGPVLADGGRWVLGLAAQLTDAEWKDLLSREFK